MSDELDTIVAADNDKYMIRCENLVKIYKTSDVEVVALQGLDLDVERGELMAIVGNSGSGKSTLLNMLGGLDRPSSGSVTVDGQELGRMNDEALTIFRRRNIGFIFQNYNLVPVLNVYENIIMPIQLDGRRPDEDYIDEILQLLGLAEKREHMPNPLPGGQQQRVAIARALAAKPQVILADEPTGNLDSATSDEVLALLGESSRRFHQTIVMITHDPQVAARADRTIRIEDGRIVAQRG